MTMNHEHIRLLLERYERAETSLDEERELREYFTGPDVAEELKTLAPLFCVPQALGEASSPNYPAGPWDAVDTDSQAFAKTGGSTASSPLRVVHRRHQRFKLAIAAAVALLVAIAIPLLLPTTPAEPIAAVEPSAIDWSKYEVTDPEEATRITRQALASVAATLNTSGQVTQRELSRIKPIHKVL